MQHFLQQCRSYFVYAGVFSFFINLLMLTVPIFMLQIFDRVLTSRSQETLILLALFATGALLLHMGLEVMRSRLLLSAGLTLESLAGPQVIAGLLHAAARQARASRTSSSSALSFLLFSAGSTLAGSHSPVWTGLSGDRREGLESSGRSARLRAPRQSFGAILPRLTLTPSRLINSACCGLLGALPNQPIELGPGGFDDFFQ